MKYSDSPIAHHQRESWLIVLFAAIAAFGYIFKANHYFAWVPGDLGDARFNSIVLEHVYQWLTGKTPDLWSPQFFFPYPDTLAFSDNHFGSVVFYAIARLAHLSREAAFNAWFCIGALLTYFSSAYALNRLGFRGLAAAAAAFAFTFALPALAQEGHAQLVYRFAIPLALLELWRSLEARNLKRLPQLCIWVAVQFFCSIYLGLFLVMLLCAIGVASFFERSRFVPTVTETIPPRVGTARNVLLWAVAATLWVGLLLMLAKYHSVAREYHVSRSPDEIRSMLPRIGSYFIADHSALTSWMGNWVRNIPMRHEHQLFFGLGISALAIFGFITAQGTPHRKWQARVLMWALFLLVIITLSVGGHSLYRWVMILPGFNSIRAVTRVCLLMLLPVSLLVAMGVEALVDRFHQHRALVVAGVALLVSLEAIAYKPTSVPVEQWRDRIQTLRSGWDADKGRNQTSIIYGLSRPGEPWLYAELDTMMLAQDMGVATVNGYSGNLPPDFGLPDACATGVKRLAQGAAFNGWPTSRTASLIPRLKVLPEAAACPDYSHLQPFAGALSEDTFRHTTIAIVSQDHDDQAYTITVSVTNKSDHYLPAVSLSNDPVQLSWQFVPESQPVDMAAWTTRMPLEVDVAAGNTLNQKVPVQLPTQPGRYQIVFSLVQDRVSWFHDKGMPLAVGAQIIEVPAPR